MSSFTKINRTVFGALMLVAVAGEAMAGEPTRTVPVNSGQVTALQAKADVARARVDALTRQGGSAYKTGALDRANQEVARFQTAADVARGSGDQRAVASVSVDLAAAQSRVQELRRAGGWAYKSGAVERAEGDVRALSRPQTVVMSMNETAAPARSWGKPVERAQRAFR